MNIPEAQRGEAACNQTTRSSGIYGSPWLTGHRPGARTIFKDFARLPDNHVRTREKLMPSPPPQHSPPGIEEMKAKWPKYVSAARVAWGEITEEELLNLETPTQQLAGLIHERYAVTREEADMQVKRFFAKYHF
jgi:uncharacterized protein YjbJ (UPF0337 family)